MQVPGPLRPSLPLWDALGLAPLNPEKQFETIQPHGLKGLDFGKGKVLNSLPVQGTVSHWVQILGCPSKSEKEKMPLILSQMTCDREHRTSFLLTGHISSGEPSLQGSYEPVLFRHILCVQILVHHVLEVCSCSPGCQMKHRMPGQ